MGYPETMPFFGHIRVDRAGNLWVQRYEPSWSVGGHRWDVLDRTGKWIATAEIADQVLAACGPVGLCADLMEIGTDYLLIERRDSLDVRYVARYRLTKDAGE